jgi:hypothetical protein
MRVEPEVSGPGFVVSMLAMSLFLAASGVAAASGRTGFLFISSLLTWLSYLSAHRYAVGELVDGKPGTSEEDGNETMTPGNTTEYLRGLTGGAILATGMAVGAAGIASLHLPITFLGALLFNAGYVTAHASTTGELL